MHINTIATDTVVYAVADKVVDLRYRGIVLDTARWERVGTGPRERRDVTGYRPAEPGRKAMYSHDSGLLVLQAGGRGVALDADRDGPPLTDAELIDLAAVVVAQIREGGLPTLPRGVKIDIKRPQDIDCLWVDHLARLDAETRRRAEERRVREERATEERAARGRLADVLGDACPSHLGAGMSWVRMEAICKAYAAAQVGTPVT